MTTEETLREETTGTPTTQATQSTDALESAQSVGDKPAEATEAAPALFDADAEQIVPVNIQDPEGETVEVVLRAAPLADETIKGYARAVRESRGSDDAGERAAAGVFAAEKFFPVLITGAEGEELEEGIALADCFTAQQKFDIVARLLLVFQPDDPPRKVVKPKKGPNLKRLGTTARVRLRCFYNGDAVDTSHVLRKPDAKVYAEGVAALIDAGEVIAAVEKYAAIYDSLHVSHEGYRGRVPLHHKAEAARVHLDRQAEFVRKN